MERWTKSINSLKKTEPVAARPVNETAPGPPSGFGTISNLAGNSDVSGQSSSADIAFAALEKRNMLGIESKYRSEEQLEANSEVCIIAYYFREISHLQMVAFSSSNRFYWIRSLPRPCLQ